jgi:formylglycine-generating enzyme required for sulfatase activity
VPVEDDCDDEDDSDCDGVLTAADCDDTDPNQGVLCGVVLSSGTFEMGCTGWSLCGNNESPVHSVTLTNDFWMTETEVTQGQWQALMGNNPSNFSSCGSDCPVETVNWYEALAFANEVSIAEDLAECYTLSGCINTPGTDMECSSVTITSTSGSPYDCTGYRLPTEAEWEYAARAGTDLLYAGSNTVSDVAWYGSNSGGTPHPVATKLPNAWDLYDMSGNVWEWTWDWYASDYYSSSPDTDPEGPNIGSYRISRGGSSHSYDSVTRVVYRYVYDPVFGPSYGIGFRLSRTVP